MKLSYRILFYLVSIFSGICFSQNQKIDSLKKILLINKDDTSKVTTLNRLSEKLYRLGIYDSALVYSDKALTILKSIKNVPKNWETRSLAKAYNNKGATNFLSGNYPEALTSYFASLKLRQQSDDKTGIAASYNNIAGVYYEQGNLTEALKNYLTALKIKEELGNKENIAGAYINIGNIYYSQYNFEEALKNYFSALKLYQKIGDKIGTASSYTNIGNVYEKLRNMQDALKYYTLSLKLSEETGNKQDIADCYLNIGVIFDNKGDYTAALKNYFISLQLAEEAGNRHGIAIATGNIGSTYFNLKKFKDAERYCLKGLQLSRAIGELALIKDYNKKLSDIFTRTGMHNKALAYFKAYISCRDSLNNEENTKRTVRMQMNYEFDKKEATTKLEQEKREAISKADSKKQKVIIWSVCGILLLVLSFAIFAYRSYLQKQKANIEITKQKHLIEEKQKEIVDSIYYARRIQRSLLPNEKYIARMLSRSRANPYD